MLRQYLLKGYILNEKRLLEQQKKEILKLQDTVSLIYNKIKTPILVGQEKELIDIIQRYTKSLTILGQYDFRSIKNVAKNKNKTSLSYKECLDVVNSMKEQLNKNNELTDLFGVQNKDEKLKGIIGAIHQTFDKKELYKTVEEKAANLLYLAVKDHPFADGNKKIAAILFVYFLNKNNFLFDENHEIKISENTLVTLILLISVSVPEEREIMINLIINLIK
ncbi:MAG: Fic family protein [Candidatus Paceibacterota bacterium]|jgi:prophage maintenance system killer protein